MARLKECLLIVLLVVAILALLHYIAPEKVHAAETRHCDKNHTALCQQAITYWKREAHEAKDAAEWQHKERIKQVRNVRGYGVDHAIRVASALYGIPRWEIDSVISCESGHDPSVVNGHRHVNVNTTPFATGLAQWLLSSWQAQGLPGFSRVDPYASVLAMGRAVVRNGGWRQWQCKPKKGT